MKMRAFVLLGVAGILLASGAARAEQLCGLDVHQKFEETRIYSRSFIATCRPGASCRVVTHRLDKRAPLGFSHTFAFQRGNATDRWHVMLVDVLQLADIQTGFSMTVDKDPAVNVSSEFITAPVSINEYRIDADLSDKLLTKAKPGDNVTWGYTTQDGEARKVRFSLAGLTKALEWVECAQVELASGKSSPPEPDDKEPEYSPPEPGVPVDPIGDGRD